MADPKIKYTFTGDSADAQAAIAKLEKKYDALENRIKQVGKKSKEAADGFADMAKGASSFAQNITGISSGMDLVTRGIQLAKAEWQDFVDRQTKAKDENLAFAQSLTKLSLATDQPLADVSKRIERLSKEGNVKQQDIPEMLNRMQAAKGNTQTDAMVDKTFLAAAKLAKFDPESMAGLAETSLDITKQMPGATPEQAIAFSLNAQAQSRVADPSQFNKNVLPAALGMNKIDGSSLEFGIALNNALTQGAGDTTGKRSGTAQVALALQLEQMLPELKSTEARVRALQENEGLRDAFLKGGTTADGKKMKGLQFDVTGPNGEVMQLDSDRASFERRMMPAIKAALTKGTVEANIMDETMRTLPTLANSGASFDARAKAVGENANLNVAERSQQLLNNAQAARIRDTGGAMSSVERAGFDDNLSASGIGWAARQSMGWSRWTRERMGQSSGEASRNTAEAYASDSRYAPRGSDATEEDKKQTAALDKLVVLMSADRQRPLNMQPGE